MQAKDHFIFKKFTASSDLCPVYSSSLLAHRSIMQCANGLAELTSSLAPSVLMFAILSSKTPKTMKYRADLIENRPPSCEPGNLSDLCHSAFKIDRLKLHGNLIKMD